MHAMLLWYSAASCIIAAKRLFSPATPKPFLTMDVDHAAICPDPSEHLAG
jgi:hypothetical protein